MGDPDDKVREVDGGDATSVMDARPAATDATWLSDSLLLVVGEANVKPGETQATLVIDDDAVEVEMRCIAVLSKDGSAELTVVTAALGDAADAAQAAKTLALGDTRLALTGLGNIVQDHLNGPRERPPAADPDPVNRIWQARDGREACPHGMRCAGSDHARSSSTGRHRYPH